MIGSKHSLKPKICDVLAVGIGATNNELRNPYSIIYSLRIDQLYRSFVGSTPHISNCNTPFEAGDPSKELYAPK